MSESVKTSLEKAAGPQSIVEKWTGHFAAYEKEFSPWEKKSEKILKRYRIENPQNRQGNAKFNILWANVQTLIPATFSRTPKSDVSRRFRDNDPVGRVASRILERGLEFEIEHYPDFRETLKACVFDRFLGGRGTAWARYEPHIRAVSQQLPTDGVEVTEDVDTPNEELDYECAPVDYVHWKDFGHTIGRTWDEITAVWRKVYMTKAALIARFGEDLAKTIPLDSTPDDKKGEQGGDNTERSRALIYEVWDKETLKAYWISKSRPEPLDEKDDPLGLEGFFPCPKPLFATLTNESLVPTPDFTLYQDQAKELDTLADRMQGLIDALQVKGVYDDSISALARIFTEGANGTLIPVKNWAAFAEKNGLAGAIDIVDLKPIYEALKACYTAVQAVLQQIYDITGLSDIIRGQSNANETATAQKIKGQYASLRLKAMQMDVAIFATQLLQLKAQIICGKFSAETIGKISAVDQFSPEDQALLPQAMGLLIGENRLQDPNQPESPNPLRIFRIEVNADSMVQMDEQEEKENRIEFLTAQGTFMEKALPMAQEAPELTPLIASLWKFGIQAFKVGKELEGEFDAVIDKLKQVAAQPRQPKPDPEMMRVQADQAAQQARVQADQQNQQNKLAFEQQKFQMEQQASMQEMKMQAFLDQQKAANEAQFERWEALLKARTQVEVAEISAQATETVAQTTAAKQAVE